MLWVKHTYMIFDREEENITRQQQVQITNWLTNWSNDLPSSMPAACAERNTTKWLVQKQAKLAEWLKSWGGNISESDHSSEYSNDCETGNCLENDAQIHCTAAGDREIVTDGTH